MCVRARARVLKLASVCACTYSRCADPCVCGRINVCVCMCVCVCEASISVFVCVCVCARFHAGAQ